MNKTLLYYSFLAASAVVPETTSAASASLLADKKSPGSVLADNNLKLLNVAGDDGRPSSTFLKTSSFLSRQLTKIAAWPDSRFLSIWSSSGFLTSGSAVYEPPPPPPKRILQGGDEAANTSSADTEVTGKITVTGFIDGVEPDLGQKNTTLEVQYNLTGCNGQCAVYKFKQNPNFCDEVAIGESGGDDSDGDIDITMYDVTNFDMQSVEDAQKRGMYYIDVNTSINQLFNKPLAVNADDGRVLACAVFKEIKSKFPIIEEETPMDDKNSGAISSFSTALVSLVATIVVIASVL